MEKSNKISDKDLNQVSGGNDFIIETNKCIACGACAEVCAADAIRPNGKFYKVDSYACLQCGYCLPYCPTGALREKKRGEK